MKKLILLLSMIAIVGCSRNQYVDATAPAIIQAAQRGDIEEVKEILKDSPSLLLIEDSKGNTAAECAILDDHHNIAIYLIEQGHPINPNNNNDFPLIFSCLSRYTSGSYEMLEYLLEHGANSNIRYEPEGWVPLNMAVSNGMKKKVRLLVKYGANLDSKDNLGTPLEFAEACVAEYKNPEFNLPHGELNDPKIRHAYITRWEGMVKLLKELKEKTEQAHPADG